MTPVQTIEGHTTLRHFELWFTVERVYGEFGEWDVRVSDPTVATHDEDTGDLIWLTFADQPDELQDEMRDACRDAAFADLTDDVANAADDYDEGED